MKAQLFIVFCVAFTVTFGANEPSLEEVCAGANSRTERTLCKQAVLMKRTTKQRDAEWRKMTGLDQVMAICSMCEECQVFVSVQCNAQCAGIKGKSYETRDGKKIIRDCIVEVKKETKQVDCTMVEDFERVAPDACISTVYDCLDLRCVLHYMAEDDAKMGIRRPPPLKPAVRKEYRQLSEKERRAFHAVLQQLKFTGDYDEFASTHSKYGQESTVAHHGSAFLPWHREFLKRFEFAMRMINPGVAIPYWDTVLDARLNNPSDSILFSHDLMGEVDEHKNVRSTYLRPFVKTSNWTTEELKLFKDPKTTSAQKYRWQNKTLQRQLSKNSTEMHPPDNDQIFKFAHQPDLNIVLAWHEHYEQYPNDTDRNRTCSSRKFEGTLENIHGFGHDFIGGDMGDLFSASNDPIFYMLHSFVDLLWEKWRIRHQKNRLTRETQYPSDQDILRCSTEKHFAQADMDPFYGFKNIYGLSNKYTDNLYTYAPRPTCTADNQDCGSDFLFCDSSSQCVSKMREGGDCSKYTDLGDDACYVGRCVDGTCQRISSREQCRLFQKCVQIGKSCECIDLPSFSHRTNNNRLQRQSAASANFACSCKDLPQRRVCDPIDETICDTIIM